METTVAVSGGQWLRTEFRVLPRRGVSAQPGTRNPSNLLPAGCEVEKYVVVAEGESGEIEFEAEPASDQSVKHQWSSR